MVLGNHDHWASTPLSLRKLEASGRSVRHRASCIKRGNDSIVIAGAGDFWCDTPGIDEALDGIPENAFRIVIAHNPDTADGIHRSRVDLYVSGHTHGGQVKIPCTDNTFLIPVRNKKYDAGLKKNRKNEMIYISKGVGWSVQPLRINCFPEITLIELRRRT
jgi:predicted MPP superfamily phosphohydrolase